MQMFTIIMTKMLESLKSVPFLAELFYNQCMQEIVNCFGIKMAINLQQPACELKHIKR